MFQFASGVKKSYYGKGDVIAYRLNRDGKVPDGYSAVFGANVLILIYGEAFWPTYTTGDNTDLIATDSMKNFIQRETMNFVGDDLESYARFLAQKFLGLYPRVEGAQVSASRIPYDQASASGQSFVPGGPDCATVSLEMFQGGGFGELRSGIKGFRLLRLSGSSFKGFVRDEYTTLPDINNRPLNMWLDLDWTYVDTAGAFNGGAVTKQVRAIVHEVFDSFESGSIQQVIYQIGTRMLTDIPSIAEIHLEANNRTWDTIAEKGDLLGLYTDARPPYGCLGLTLRR